MCMKAPIAKARVYVTCVRQRISTTAMDKAASGKQTGQPGPRQLAMEKEMSHLEGTNTSYVLERYGEGTIAVEAVKVHVARAWKDPSTASENWKLGREDHAYRKRCESVTGRRQ